MSEVKLISVTPDAEKNLVYMARVSSNDPENKSTKLINYLLMHKHWSPFEMAHMTVSIRTTRDISRQILRHRSFSFQEFSQRYQVAPPSPKKRKARTQDPKNRQSSHPVADGKLSDEWEKMQDEVWTHAYEKYQRALSLGIAKEQARALLPEGLTQTHMYMTGSVRSWIHYLEPRCAKETQAEHREVADSIKALFIENFPTCSKALGWCL
jgi:thymidylate synthase (FAD)